MEKHVTTETANRLRCHRGGPTGYLYETGQVKVLDEGEWGLDDDGLVFRAGYGQYRAKTQLKPLGEG